MPEVMALGEALGVSIQPRCAPKVGKASRTMAQDHRAEMLTMVVVVAGRVTTGVVVPVKASVVAPVVGEAVILLQDRMVRQAVINPHNRDMVVPPTGRVIFRELLTLVLVVEEVALMTGTVHQEVLEVLEADLYSFHRDTLTLLVVFK